MPLSLSAVSVIVPAYHEAPNLEPLIRRVFAAMAKAGREAELIVVDDDSQDGTDAIVASLQSSYPVRLIVRRNERGLSSAVLAGFRAATHDRIVVMDADLQHPPEMIPALVDRLDQDGCDFVIGTRYAGRGAIDERWPAMRRLASWVATCLAKPLVPLSDPMSGFFALHRATWEQADRLDPIGYKIALELYVKGRCRCPGEVPIQFEARVAGKSKLSFAEQVRYLRHLSRLYTYRFPRLTVVVLAAVLVALLAVALAVVLMVW